MLAKRDFLTVLGAVAAALLLVSGVWGAFAFVEYREQAAIEARMVIARKAGEQVRIKQRAAFPERRAALVKEMRDALASGAKIGVADKAAEFQSVADEEYLALLKQVRAMDSDVKASSERDTARKDERANRAITYARLLRKQAHDPDSVEFKAVFVSEESQAICYEYQARNGFNALRRASFMITSKGELKADSSDGFVKAWNRDCVGKNGYDAHAAANIYK